MYNHFKLLVEFFTLFEHCNTFLNTRSAHFRVLCGSNTPDECISIRLVQRFEEAFGTLGLVERGCEIRGNCGVLLRFIGHIPSTISLRSLNLFQTWLSHSPCFKKRFNLLDIHPRPQAFWPTRRKLLQVVCLVVGLALTIYPAIAQCHIERLHMAN